MRECFFMTVRHNIKVLNPVHSIPSIYTTTLRNMATDEGRPVDQTSYFYPGSTVTKTMGLFRKCFFFFYGIKGTRGVLFSIDFVSSSEERSKVNHNRNKCNVCCNIFEKTLNIAKQIFN